MTTPLAEILLRDTTAPVRAVLDKSLDGLELSRDDAAVLLRAGGRDLQALCADCGDAKGDSVPEEVEVFSDTYFSRCPSDAYAGMFW